MKFEIRDNRDLYAGLVFVALGAGALFMSQSYNFGSSTQMGPGYFPTILSVVLILLGLVVSMRGLSLNEKITIGWSPRAIVALSLAVVLFALLLPVLGIVPALAVLIFGSAAATSEFRWLEVTALTVVLTSIIGVLVSFVLDMPYPLFGAY